MSSNSSRCSKGGGPEANVTNRKIVESPIEELTVHACIEERISYPVDREATPDTKDHLLDRVDEEEEEWFPDVRGTMGRKRLQEVGKRMLDVKSSAPRDPLRLRISAAWKRDSVGRTARV